MALPKAIRRLTPDRVRDDSRLRALAVGSGVIPPRTMHSSGEGEGVGGPESQSQTVLETRGV